MINCKVKKDNFLSVCKLTSYRNMCNYLSLHDTFPKVHVCFNLKLTKLLGAWWPIDRVSDSEVMSGLCIDIRMS